MRELWVALIDRAAAAYQDHRHGTGIALLAIIS
jgi:hypothetical protein